MANTTSIVTAATDGAISTVVNQVTFGAWLTELGLTASTSDYDQVTFCPGSTLTCYQTTVTTSKSAVGALAQQNNIATAKTGSHAVMAVSAGAPLRAGLYYVNIYSDCAGR